MIRRVLVAAALIALAACAHKARIAEPLPAQLGTWQRTAFNDHAGAPAGSIIPPSSIAGCLTATYTGAGTLDVTLYELSSSATALDAVQRWHPAADTVIFQRDEYFIVVHFQAADRKAVNAFVRDLDRRLTAK